MSAFSYRLTLAALFVPVFLAIAPVALVHAQSRDRSETSQQSEAATAWRALQRDAQSRLRDAEDRDAAARSVMDDLVAFTNDHPDAPETAAAWFNHGALADRTDQPEIAERSLKKAIKLAEDPRLKSAAEGMLAQLSLRPGKTPPDFTATTIEDKRIELTDYRGEVVLLDFWATWCAPCIAELPNVKRVYDQYHDKGFRIISISLDREKKALRQFVDKREIRWPQIYDADRASDKQIARLYGVNAIPQMILVGRDGKIIDTRLRGPALEKAVASAVTGEPPENKGDDQTPEPWEYDQANDRHWDPSHNHWHDGPPPQGVDAPIAATPPAEDVEPWFYDEANNQHWDPGHNHWHRGPPPPPEEREVSTAPPTESSPETESPPAQPD